MNESSAQMTCTDFYVYTLNKTYTVYMYIFKICREELEIQLNFI